MRLWLSLCVYLGRWLGDKGVQYQDTKDWVDVLKAY